MFVLVLSNFVVSNMSYVAWLTFGISIVYFLILVPFYGYIIMSIINEQMEETIQTVSQKDFYQKMFDAMQQGICTVDNGKVLFMNELCNMFTSELSGLKDFEMNINENEEKDKLDQMDRKIFYQFQHENGDDKIKGFKKAKMKISSNSDGVSQKSGGTGSSKSSEVKI